MAKIYIDTTGCSMNFSDSELMMGLLEKEEHEIVDNEKDAEVVILNGCNVKGPTETAFFRKINELKNKKVILTGCVPQSMPEKVADFNVVGTYQLNKITIAVDKTLKGEKFCFLEQTHSDRFDLPKKRVNPVIDIVPINSGCLGACTFCITKKARGILYSYDHKKIISHIKKSASEGVREFWLTSQDTACWGMDKRDNLVNLLKDIVAINGDFKVRLGMGNPNHFKHYIDRLLDIFENEKMFQFMHIPVQAGNNRILKEMKRGYTAEEYKELIFTIKKRFPLMTISTDVICGFPTETEVEFIDTYNLIKETRPEVLNISRFWIRPGTKAASMKQISGEETKRRSTMLTSLFKKISLENNKKWLGWKGNVLIDEIEKDGFGARNFAYKKISLKENCSLGDTKFVEICDADTFCLKAREIKEKPVLQVID